MAAGALYGTAPRTAPLHPEQGLVVGECGSGRARPDGVPVPKRYFAGRGEWSDPSGVPMVVVEVTSTRPGGDRPGDR